MAEELDYEDSVYRFTDPVRYFKANDPYFFEVDNIPIKQLEENCKWLKDQLIRTISDAPLGIKRRDLDELRPYATGADRVIRVKPGRFTARINDGVTKEPLQYLKKIGASELPGAMEQFKITAANAGAFPSGVSPSWNTLLVNVLEKFRDSLLLSQNALGMTGLENRITTRPIYSPDTPLNGTGVNWYTHDHNGSISYSPMNYVGRNPNVVNQALLWARSDGSVDNWIAETLFTPTDSLTQLGMLESQLIKKWRGIARTSIVDISEEITVEVPPFSPNDFNYFDEEGTEIQIEGAQSRIDMVFIYSKSIDASAAQIARGGDAGANIPGTTITKPILGIVRGAGISMRYSDTDPNVTLDSYKRVAGADADLNPKIMASPGDQNNADMGFTATSGNDVAFDVRGSFPSPDDILNIAPLISEKLENNALELVGQSILPVAYVWVQNGSTVVVETDVIDIRPLFRTAELAYNERAGIAAATPQLSLANPAVGRVEVDWEIKRVNDALNIRVDQVEAAIPEIPHQGQAATGWIYGGLAFGPEGVLYDFMHRATQGGSDEGGVNDLDVLEKMVNGTDSQNGANLGVIDGGDIPVLPDWDVAEWVGKWTELDHPGGYPGDFITPVFTPMKSSTESDTTQSPMINGACWMGEGEGSDGGGAVLLDGIYDTATYGRLKNCDGMYEINALTTHNMMAPHYFYLCKKKIYFTRPNGCVDYHVNVNLANCIGAAGRGSLNRSSYTQSAGFCQGLWVEKGRPSGNDAQGTDYFIVYVAWAGKSINQNAHEWSPRTSVSYWAIPVWGIQSGGGGGSGPNGMYMNRSVRVDRWNTAGWYVMNENIMNFENNEYVGPGNVPYCKGYKGNPKVGRSVLPSVSWSLSLVMDSDRHHTDLGNNPNLGQLTI